MPSISGNDVNGLGETAPRRPSVVYWAPNPADIAHGRMQQWFYTVDPGLPAFRDEREKRRAAIAAPLPDLALDRVSLSAEAWRKELNSFVDTEVCDMIGAAELDEAWLFEGHKADWRNVIMMGFQHDYAEIEKAPDPHAGAEVMRQYSRAAIAAKILAGAMRRKGWDAEPVTGPMTGALALIPAAIAAGFGELGKHGSIINPDFGSSFRLSAVLTDAPVPLSAPRDHGVDDFCAACRICEDACPPEAIAPKKKTVRGIEKWYVDFDRCLPFFNETQGCAICIAVCPWSRPGIGLNLAAKLERRARRSG
ncbi:MAG: 4Fe-4S dicluster domain-containing protein [Pseudomonadota bacterium]